MIEVTNIEVGLPAHLMGNLSQETITGVVKDIAEAARAEWLRLAGESLHTTRETYMQSIQPVAMAPGQATISLVGALANVVENDMPEMDLRTTLLGPNSQHKKQAKDGHYYLAVPFRHAVPNKEGSAGANVGPQMGKAYAGVVADHKKLGREVYRKAKHLKPSIGEPHKQTRWGERLAQKVGGAPLLKPHHKSDIYAGMVKVQKTYGKATQSKYMTFRTISEANPEGWIRPATQGKHLAEQVAKFVEEIAPASFAAYVEGLTIPPEGAKPGVPS